MPVTSYTDPGVAWAAWALQARTNSSGTPLDDAGGEDARLAHEGFTAGVFGTNDFQVLQNSPTGMSVLVGSGSAKDDVAQIQGTDAGQGFYRVRLGTATTTVTITAADASNPRIDEIYLVVQDNAYDTSGNVVPRIGYRRGDAAGSPSAPGPDAAWDAYLLIATVAVAASATSIVNANITDERVYTGVALGGLARIRVSAGGGTLVDAPTGNAVALRVDEANELTVSDGIINANHNALINVASVDSEIDNSVQVASFGAINTGTMTTIASLTLNIPAGWGSWKCVAWASYFANQSAGNDYTSVIRIDGTDGQQKGSVLGSGTSSVSDGFVGAHRTGITTTGNRTIALRMIGTGAVISDIFLYARAVRTS